MRPTLVGWLLATTLSSTACYTRTPVTIAQLTGLRPVRVWVTRADQSVIVVNGPQVYDNKLVGFVDGKYREMPAADLKNVIMQSPARGRTTALVVAGALGIITITYLITGSGNEADPCAGESSDCFPD